MSAIEPFASSPTKRFETLRILSDAGIDTAVAVAPIIPGLNDHQIPRILKRARDAGCRTIDGLGMLVEQGRIGTELWTGLEPDAAPMRAGLEAVFG